MRTILIGAVAAIALTALVAGTVIASQQSMNKLIPSESELVGWKKLDADAWGDKEEAFFKILNGGAEVYTEAGGREIAYRAFKREKKILQATVIDMTDWQKSKAFYLSRRKGFEGKDGYTSLKISNAGFSCTTGATTSGYLWCGKFYAELSVNGSSAVEVEALQKCARLIGTKIKKNS